MLFSFGSTEGGHVVFLFSFETGTMKLCWPLTCCTTEVGLECLSILGVLSDAGILDVNPRQSRDLTMRADVGVRQGLSSCLDK